MGDGQIKSVNVHMHAVCCDHLSDTIIRVRGC